MTATDTKLTANLAKARQAMARFTSRTVPHLIAGEAVLSASGATLETLDPTTNERQAIVAAGDQAEIDRAAAAARKAFPAWKNASGAKRRAVLHAIADAIEARAEEIALVESMNGVFQGVITPTGPIGWRSV